LYNWYSNSQNNEKIETKTELKEIKEIPIDKKEPKEIASKSTLSFAKPLDDLTKSVTEISKFNSTVKNQNIIPVIGSMFEYNSTDISNSGNAILEGFANEYKKIEVPVNVLIEGFTCTIGSADYNQTLGEKRANNLKSKLIDLGIDESVIIIKPIGKQNFVSTNNGNNDLVLNRRSNVTIMSAE
jgi:outer membrane protein OmpA-like peptidoglycan-associated protein